MNQESARYSVIEDDFYVPEPQHWAINTSKDKQATEQVKVDPRVADALHHYISSHNQSAYQLYKALLDGQSEMLGVDGPWIDIPGIAREQARMVLSQNIFSRLVWKQDLKNHLHFLMLRTDSHAQFEIREYADAMARVVEKLFPATWASFKDNVIEGVSFSKTEWSVIHAYLKGTALGLARTAELGWTTRRVGEFLDKCKKAGFGFAGKN
jgi:thymidylate synthase (FAD)